MNDREKMMGDAEEVLSHLTVKELRAIGSKHFNGCLGGASSKNQIVTEMVVQLRHWLYFDCNEHFDAAMADIMPAKVVDE